MSETEIRAKKKHTGRNILLGFLAFFLVFWAIARAGMENNKKYMGHGFEYMHGYSSTDFTGYHVYDSEKLYKLDHTASLRIENEEDFPVLDGAEACYPVYSALALAAYNNIGTIEKELMDEAEARYEKRDFSDDDYPLLNIMWNNGKYVTFTNSSQAYYRLCDGIADMVIGAAPSASQKDYATRMNEQIMTTPIGKEAFVFFTQADNPVDNLTSEQIRSIYHGDITNWKDVGGKNQKIAAFQRPEESGSQVAMRWFMGDVPLADPKTVEFINVGPMGGVVTQVAQYNDEKGALGYTFRYFLTGLSQEENVKILSVDGVYPDTESIKNGTYPATVNLVCATLVSNENPYVKAMLDFMLSDDGQEIIENTGYAPLPDKNVTPTIQNNLELEGETFVSGDGGTFTAYTDPATGSKVIFELEWEGQKMKGMVGSVYTDGKIEAVENRYQFFGLYGGFQCEIAYDPENESFIFAKTLYCEDDCILPPDGTVFTKAE